MGFENQYEKIKQLAANETGIIEKKILENIYLPEPVNTNLVEFLSAPSKRLRVVLPVLYVKAAGRELNEKQSDILSVVEIVHNASLLHDDVIDESSVRRGQETLYKKFGSKIAVIAGDYMLSIALDKLCKSGNTLVTERFSKTIRQMCIGEITQNYSRFKKGTLDDYIEKTKNKTAYLFETAFCACLMLDDECSGLVESAGRLGMNIGIAFQVRDDIINITNTDKSKPFNNDIAAGIYNAPVILGNAADNYSSGIEKTKGLLNNYIDDAEKELGLLPVNKFSKAIDECLELLRNV